LEVLDDGRIWFFSGQLAERCGRIERAIECYDAAARLGGRSACEATERLAAIYLVTEDYQRAREMLRWLVEARPEEFAVRMELASVLTLLGDNEAAIRAYEEAILLEPDNWEARNDLAARLEDEGRFGEALDELRTVLRKHPEFADVQLQAARVCARLGHLDEAAECVEAALTVNPRYLEALVFKGLLLTEQSADEAAAATFQRAISVNEGYVLAYAGLALAQERAGHHDQSAETLELARRIAPSSEEIYARLSQLGLMAALKSQGSETPLSRLDAGGNRLAESTEGADRVTDRAAPAGLDHDLQMRRQIAMHRRAVQEHPRFADLRYYFGLLLSSFGRTAEAMEHYRAAVEINPTYAEALTRLALGYWQMNRPSEARQALERAAIVSGRQLRSHYRFGLLCSDRGLWPLTAQKLKQQEPAAGERALQAAVVMAMQNLGIADDQRRDYLASLHLVDQRDCPAEVASREQV
ncbi:MAG: tetratricopeptide repeat protein, partial [Anaerolineaceae bacterium]|nr:tetratricopeptide repeat protein [Anaerolineaceae bacterium]